MFSSSRFVSAGFGGVLLGLLVGLSALGKAQTPADYVNPLIDTHKSRWFFFSSASRPFGMVNLSPDTAVDGSWQSGYLYDQTEVLCFSHIHAWQLSGVPVMPVTGDVQQPLRMDATKSGFSHEGEVVEPGYHKLTLERYGVDVELTSTSRVGWHRYTFPAGAAGSVLFYTGELLGHGPVVDSRVSRAGETTVEGACLMARTRRRPKDTWVYFVAEFNRPFDRFCGWHGDAPPTELASIAGEGVGASVTFDDPGIEPLLMKVGISYTSVENARKNLEAEAPGWDFDRVRQESTADWNRLLSRIEVEGGTEAHRVKFYTDLWHALLGRRTMSDVDGGYCDMTGAEPVIRQKALDPDGNPIHAHYNFDALWGSHWSLNVLWSVAYPQVVDAFCNTMVDMYRDGGLIPRGPSGGNYTFVMIGDPASSFFATAYNRGIRNYDAELAYEGLRKNAFPGGIRDHAGYEHAKQAAGGGMPYYVELGYVPEDMGGAGGHRNGASMTLEYSYQDWCLAQFAKALGKQEDCDYFTERSFSYRRLWDPEHRLIRPRWKDGRWLADFTPIGEGFTCKGFTESNSTIYSNFVPHDMPGLIELFGGPEAYANFLNDCFEKSEKFRFVADHGHHAEMWVDYDNQPGTAMAHLFNAAGKPWLSQKWVRKVKELAHGDTTPYGGYHGDEDQGQMGALGVLMAIGLFQIDGGAAADSPYEITTPLFDRVVINLDNGYHAGRPFEIVAHNQGPENVYIQSARLNGEPLQRCWLRPEEVTGGGLLELELGPEPNVSWGIAPR